MNCEQFELIKYLNRVQDDINTLINSIQEVSLAQASVLLIRNALTTEDIFTATSQANNIVNRISKGEVVEYSQKENGKPKSAGGDKSEKGPVSRLARTGDLLYNLSAKIHVYTNGIEISQQKIGSFSALNESIDYGGDFDDDEGADDGAFDDDGDEWTPHGPRTVKRVATKKTGKRKGPGSSGDSKRQRKESPRRGSPRRQPTEDLVFKQEAPDDDWDEDNSFADLPVGMIKQEQFDEFDQDLSESLDMMYDNQDQEDEDSMTSPSTSSKKIAGYPKGVPFTEIFKQIIAFHKYGAYPPYNFSKDGRQLFRRRCRRFQLVEDDQLVRFVKGKARMVIPDPVEQQRLTQEAHEGATDGYKFRSTEGRHLGRDKTLACLADKYFWMRMKGDVTSCIGNCEHCKTQATTPARPELCSECGRVCRTGWELKKHMLTHSDERPFACNICPATFKQSSGLVYHTKSHNGERLHKCDQCGKDFITKKSLLRHYLVHTGERPYLCGICGSTFTQKETLNKHQIRIHATSPREHVCTVCGKEFVEKQTLVRHMRTHTGEKPFECPHCGRAFAIKYKMKLHINSNEVDIPQQCGKCGKGFMWKCAFDSHSCIGQQNPRQIGSIMTSFGQQYETTLGLGDSSLAGQTSNVLVAPTQSYSQIVTVGVESQQGVSVPVLVASNPPTQVHTFPPY